MKQINKKRAVLKNGVLRKEVKARCTSRRSSHAKLSSDESMTMHLLQGIIDQHPVRGVSVCQQGTAGRNYK